MDEQNKPKARKVTVAGTAKKVEKQGEGLGTGPVGNTGGYEDRKEQQAARPAQGGMNQRPSLHRNGAPKGLEVWR